MRYADNHINYQLGISYKTFTEFAHLLFETLLLQTAILFTIKILYVQPGTLLLARLLAAIHLCIEQTISSSLIRESGFSTRDLSVLPFGIVVEVVSIIYLVLINI